MPLITKEELKEKLPPREYWFVRELAEAFGVHSRTIQYAAKRKGIGRKVRQGPKGTYVFQDEDLDQLLVHIHGEVGNPVNIAIKRERISQVARKLA